MVPIVCSISALPSTSRSHHAAASIFRVSSSSSCAVLNGYIDASILTQRCGTNSYSKIFYPYPFNNCSIFYR
jgi:hypothetical protein